MRWVEFLRNSPIGGVYNGQSIRILKVIGRSLAKFTSRPGVGVEVALDI